MPIKTVFFDFDGVIANTEDLHLWAFQLVLKNHDFVMSREAYFEKYVGYDDKNAFYQFFKDNDAPVIYLAQKFIERLSNQKTKFLQNKLKRENPIYDGAAQVIKKLAKQMPLAIVSGALKPEIELILEQNKILRCFQFILDANDSKQCKPSPEPYLLAYARMKSMHPSLEKKEVAVIEDSPAGIESANNAGLKVIALKTHYTSEQDQELADCLINKISDVTPELIKTL